MNYISLTTTFLLSFSLTRITSFSSFNALLDSDDINTLSELSASTNYDPSNATFYYSTNYLNYYFSNLQGNMGRNVRGTCGLVAIGMLLSYYDSSTNDSIIPDGYDINNVDLANVSFYSRNDSPGTLCETIPQNCNYLIDSQYNNFVYSQRNVSLHCKLITMNNYVYGTNYSSRYNVVNNFLSNVSNISNYSINGINYEGYFYNGSPLNTRQYYSNLVKQYIVQKIQNNIPVLVSATNQDNSSHHAFVIYGYESATDSFISNLGWGYGNSHVLLNSSSTYRFFKTAMTISFVGHSHSDNYVFRCPSNHDEDNYSECPCGYSEHSIHLYTCYYSQLTSVKHRAYCCCGSSKQEVHNLDIEGTCVLCGYHDYGWFNYGDVTL